jgi:hypothetical protein
VAAFEIVGLLGIEVSFLTPFGRRQYQSAFHSARTNPNGLAAEGFVVHALKSEALDRRLSITAIRQIAPGHFQVPGSMAERETPKIREAVIGCSLHQAVRQPQKSHFVGHI